MNVQASTMQVDLWKARTAYREYRELVQSNRASKEDDVLRRAYREITLGKVVLDINLAIASAGCDQGGLPRLAIARADWPFVHVWWHQRQRVVFANRVRPTWWRGQIQAAAHNVAVPMPLLGSRQGDTPTGKAQVPSIPPAHRPKGALSGYRILFEAVWERRPPGDPMLLRSIGGPFYVVLAQWDLSPLEQAVLRARL